MSQTKAQALEEITADGSRCYARNHVLAIVTGHPGLSRAEIAGMAGMRISSVCGRVHELTTMGKVLTIGTKRDSVTKKTVDRIYRVLLQAEQQELFGRVS